MKLETKHTQMHERLKPVLETLEKISIEEKIKMNLLLGLAGRTWYLNNHSDHYDYQLGSIFQQIFTGKDPYKHQKLFVDQGIYLLEKLEVGRARWTDTKKFLADYVNLPSYETIRKKEKDKMPELKSTEKGGIFVDIPDVIVQHLSETIEHLSDYDKDSFKLDTLYTKWTLGQLWSCS